MNVVQGDSENFMIPPSNLEDIEFCRG